MASSLSSSPTPGSRAVLRGAGPCATQQEHSSGAGPPEFDSHPDVFHLSAWGKLTNFPRALLRNRIRTPLPCKLVITPSCRRKLHAGELHYRLDSAREPGFEFWVPPARGHWGNYSVSPSTKRHPLPADARHYRSTDSPLETKKGPHWGDDCRGFAVTPTSPPRARARAAVDAPPLSVQFCSCELRAHVKGFNPGEGLKGHGAVERQPKGDIWS